jgi:hypothetical protein
MQTPSTCVTLIYNIQIPNEICEKIFDELDNYDILIAEWVCTDWRRLLTNRKNNACIDASNLILFKPELSVWAFDNGCKIFGAKINNPDLLLTDLECITMSKHYYDNKFNQPHIEEDSKYFNSDQYYQDLTNTFDKLFALSEFNLLKSFLIMDRSDAIPLSNWRHFPIFLYISHGVAVRGKIKFLRWMIYNSGGNINYQELITLAERSRDKINRQKISALERELFDLKHILKKNNLI